MSQDVLDHLNELKKPEKAQYHGCNNRPGLFSRPLELRIRKTQLEDEPVRRANAEIYRQRLEQGLDIWTGEPLDEESKKNSLGKRKKVK